MLLNLQWGRVPVSSIQNAVSTPNQTNTTAQHTVVCWRFTLEICELLPLPSIRRVLYLMTLAQEESKSKAQSLLRCIIFTVGDHLYQLRRQSNPDAPSHPLCSPLPGLLQVTQSQHTLGSTDPTSAERLGSCLSVPSSNCQAREFLFQNSFTRSLGDGRGRPEPAACWASSLPLSHPSPTDNLSGLFHLNILSSSSPSYSGG